MGIGFWLEWKISRSWRSFFTDDRVRRYWEDVFDKSYRGRLDSWAVPWNASVWYKNGLTVTPNINLLSNIGFGLNSTHTGWWRFSPLSEMATGAMKEIRHPAIIKQDTVADRRVFDFVFGNKYRRLTLDSSNKCN